jgi:hypothetical protein
MILISKIPYLNVPDDPMITASQDHLPISDIMNDMVLFKDGGAAIVMETTSLNFGLLSIREQEAVIASYAALINSLSFPVQILVRTQKKDVSIYLRYLDEAAPKIVNPKLAGLMSSYKKFISETIKKKNVLGKKFYIIIPFSSFELGLNRGSFFSLSNKPKQLAYTKSYIVKKAEIALLPKRDHVMRQTSRLGIRARQLTDTELIALYYDTYNPLYEHVQSVD